MGLEMVGARLLWNDFGSSVFVWGSIISVFMAALALGYYWGGRLADRHPSLSGLAGLAGVAGLLIVGISHFGPLISATVDRWQLGPRGGPLAASLLLYSVPSVLLGMVSPFAVRLSTRNVSSVGNVAGRLYALSTIGSFSGTLLTTFVLIPLWGTTRILFSIGVLILAAAGASYLARYTARGGPTSSWGRIGQTTVFLLVLGMAWRLCPWAVPGSLPPTLSLQVEADAKLSPFILGNREYESAYHNIAVIAWLTKDRPWPPGAPYPPNVLWQAAQNDPDAILEMRFNNLTESAIYPGQPGQPPKTTYTRLVHLAMALHPDARRVLVIGLGGGSIPREFCDIYADRNIAVDVVEVDPLVVDLARRYFFHTDSPDPSRGVRTYLADGRQFLRRGLGRHSHYDLIVLDAYSGGGSIPGHLVTREFFQEVRKRLAEDGWLLSNIIASLTGPKSRFFLAEYRTLRDVFPVLYVFATWLDMPTTTRNLIVLASRRPRPLLTPLHIREAARALLERYPRLRARTASESYRAASLEDFATRQIVIPDGLLASAPLLTDDYAPVETLFYWTHRGRD